MTEVVRVDVTQLGPLNEVGRGVRSTVFAAPSVTINNAWSVVYKQYAPEARARLDVAALERSISFLDSIGDERARWLCERAAWPAALVTTGTVVSGFLMREMPHAFVARPGDEVRRDELTVLEFLRDTAETLAAFDGWGIASATLSPDRLLLSPRTRPRCFFIGCDSAVVTGGPVTNADAFGALVTRSLFADAATGLAERYPGLAELARRGQDADPVVHPATVDWIAALDTATNPDAPDATQSTLAIAIAIADADADAVAGTVEAVGEPPGGYSPPSYYPLPPELSPSWPEPVGPPHVGPSPVGPPPQVEPTRGRPRRTAVLVTVALAALALLGGAGVAAVMTTRSSNVTGPSPVPVRSTVAGSPSIAASATTTPTPSPTPTPTRIGIVDLSAVTGDVRAVDIATMFDTYLSAINAKDYPRALSMYDPAGAINPTDPRQQQAFVAGVSTTTEAAASLLSISPGDGGQVAVEARLSLRSTQQPGYGPKGRESETCTVWDLTYALSSPGAHQYRILRASGQSRAC